MHQNEVGRATLKRTDPGSRGPKEVMMAHPSVQLTHQTSVPRLRGRGRPTERARQVAC
jgi:hypothetical protein